MLPIFALLACHAPVSEPFETTRDEEWRPQVHYSPEANWLNDPVGLVRADDAWHLFYQHNPDADVWGPMHWGHAVSLDLLHWEERPIALSPDPILGTVFSGSALALDEALPGVCDGPCIVLMFTHNGGDSGDQKQSIATSEDGGWTFTVHPASPVITNPGLAVFRDPKLFRFGAGFRMLISEGEVLGLYGSPDLLSWEKLAEVSVPDVAGVLETPDLSELPGSPNGDGYLAIAMNPGGPAGGSGQFWATHDGQAGAVEAIKPMDYGADFYAFQTWQTGGDLRDLGDGLERPVGTAWASNWSYALRTPTEGWRGSLAFPRSLSRWDRSIAQSFHGVQALVRGTPVDLVDATPMRMDRALADFEGQVYRLRYVDPHARSCELRLLEGDGAATVIAWDGAMLSFDRSQSGEVDFADDFAAVHEAPLVRQGIDLDILVDRSMVEVLAGEGLVAFTERVFPPQGATGVSIACEGTDRASLTIDELQSIWR
ncbi:MAG: glycoside hydrolase family 32 protein [Proteobacteria bacterium]|nr:glycoside hydrolase family 32 protein [Pseudomonadota bacterium]